MQQELNRLRDENRCLKATLGDISEAVTESVSGDAYIVETIQFILKRPELGELSSDFLSEFANTKKTES